jgi:hypothetical protein
MGKEKLKTPREIENSKDVTDEEWVFTIFTSIFGLVPVSTLLPL